MNKEYQIQYIKENYRSKTNKEIGNHLGLTARQVWTRANKLGLTNKQKPEFQLTHVQEQIILSGIVGDGGLKKNGNYGYYYRETHAADEREYVTWKFNTLHPMTQTTNMRYAPPRHPSHQPQYLFVTTTTPTLVKYAKMTKIDVISKLKPLGLCLLLMDDGWIRTYKHTASLHLGVESLTDDEKDLLVSLYQSELNVDAWITNKRKSIAIGTGGTKAIYELLVRHMGRDVDVLKKKFPMYY